MLSLVSIVIAGAAIACSPNDRAITGALTSCSSLLTVTVSPATATLHPGDSLHVSVSADKCSAANPATAAYRWTSSDPTVSTVDSLAGMVHARRTGTVTIIATSSTNHSVQGAMEVHVAP
jgi:uncharacterized protein YjdB